MTGPGVYQSVSFHALPDGAHAFDASLEAGGTYEVLLSSYGGLEQTGSGSQRLTFYVLAPEPARPLLALVGAAALAGAPGARRRAVAPLSRCAGAS